MTQEKPSLMSAKQLLAKFHWRENKESFLQVECIQIAPTQPSPLLFYFFSIPLFIFELITVLCI